jgi:hypothetical protein
LIAPLVAPAPARADRATPQLAEQPMSGFALALAHEWLKRANASDADSPLEESLLELLTSARVRRGRFG